MKSVFDDARQLIQAAIQQCFGSELVVMLPDGQQRKIQGYIKHQSSENHAIKRLLTASCLPPLSTMMIKGKRYSLAFSGHEQGKGNKDSQLQREYVLNLSQAGIKHDFSEF